MHNTNNQKDKIAVIGAGAIGCIVGGLLAKVGYDVTLIGRKDNVDEINKSGLSIDGIFGKMKINIKAKENLDFEPDIVFLAVKTQDVKIAIEENKSFISNSIIVTMQNGMESDKIVASILGQDNIFSSVVFFGGNFLEPGKVTLINYNKKGSLVVGRAFGNENDTTTKIINILNKALPTKGTSNIIGAHWTKLIFNQSNAIPAVTGIPMQEIAKNKKLVKLQIMLMKEALYIVEKSGATPCSLPGAPISLIKFIMNLPLIFSKPLFRLQSKFLENLPSPGSTLQSISRNKSTEIDYLNGEIVKLGEKIKTPTPYNSTIVDLVHQVSESKKFFSADEIWSYISAHKK